MKHTVLLLFSLVLLAGCSRTASQSPVVGNVSRDTILGVPCCVYLPNDYPARSRTERFPVLYLLHGMYGSEDDWTVQGNLLHWMDSLLTDQSVGEMVVVMPDNFLGSIPPDGRQALMASPDITPDGESFSTSSGSAHWRKLTSEQERAYEMSGYWETHFPLFMAETEKRYSIAREPSGRAIAGLSMGGFHTMHISHYMPATFAYIGLFSPAVILADSVEPYIDWQPQVIRMMDAHPLYWIAIGREDHLFDFVQNYRSWLEDNHLEYTYYQSAGGHTWPNWQDYLVRFLTLTDWK